MKIMNIRAKSKAELFVLVASVLVACGVSRQDRATEAQNKVPVPDRVNYYERGQVAQAELLNDRPGRIFFWYVLSDDGRLLGQFTCIGRPNSSTESLEPNEIFPYSSYNVNQYGFAVPLEGGDVAYSSEAMGLDGTYGEPVPYRYCVSPEGHYFDVALSVRTIVSTVPLTFPAPETRFDAELEAKKLIAERALQNGQCVDSALNVIDCQVVNQNLEGGEK